jgi:hypothetical protein
VHANDKTERVPALGEAMPAADTITGQADDPTESQQLVLSDEPSELQRTLLSEQPTVALPDATNLATPTDPPTVVLSNDELLAATGALVPRRDGTEPTPCPQPAAGLVTAGPDADAPTVADVNLSTVRRARPAQVPGYDLIDLLGTGSYGAVWLAQEQRTGIRVAIKFLNHDTGIEWQLIQAEVKQLALLHTDPGIVQLLDVELDRRPPYYIMAYAEHGSLARRLEQGPLPLEEALDVFKQLAEALAYVHAKGVRHCDLKPGNVLLKARKRVLIADFGQAQLSSAATPALGTFFYMAPEQAHLSKQIPDTRWDVYGLGAIFYALLTGHPPREDVGVRQDLAQIKDLAKRLEAYRDGVQRAPKPEKHRGVAGMDRQLAEILDRCLEVDPVRRLRDAGAVLAALTRRERLKSQRPLLVFGFVAQILLCLVVGAIAYWGVQAGIGHTEEALLQRLANDRASAAVVEEGMNNLRWKMNILGIAITAGVTLVLSALWGWLIWTLRRKDRLQQ